jgi:hypothetical protein
MPRIRSLKPNVTREEAIRQFSPRGPFSVVHRTVLGPLRSVAELYIPFRFFHVQIQNRGRLEGRIVALDAVSGGLDLYQFEHLPAESETVYLETRNCPAADLADEEAVELVIAKLRRLLYSRGFFRMRDLQIAATPIAVEIHIPYWIGFRGSGTYARLGVIDAVRRRVEGAKVRRLVEAWLTTHVA